MNSASNDTEFERLLTALADRDPGVREDAVVDLAELGDERAVEPLIAALADEDSAVRNQAAKALAKFGDLRAVEPLVAALQDEDSYVNLGAAESLGQLGDERAVEPLIACLKSEDVVLRYVAAEALARIGDDRALEPLTAALEDEEEDVRSRAATALGKLGDTSALRDEEDEALKIVKQAAVPSHLQRGPQPSQSQISDAVGRLGELRSRRAIEPLIAVILEVTNYDLQATCSWALAQIGEPALKPITAALDDERNFRVGGGAEGFLLKAREAVESADPSAGTRS